MKTVGQSNNGNTKILKKIICDSQKFGTAINLYKKRLKFIVQQENIRNV